MSFDLPPFIKQAESVRALAERAVATWPRYHRYAHGTDLRRQAKEVVRLAHLAWSNTGWRAQLLQDLAAAVDNLKADLRLGQHIKVFRSFGQFEEIMRAARDLGQQCGALCKAYPVSQHSKGQNAAASRAAAARPDTEYPVRLAEANT